MMCDILQLPTTHSTSFLPPVIVESWSHICQLLVGWNETDRVCWFITNKPRFASAETYFQLFGLIDWKRNNLDFNTFKEESVHRYTLGLSFDSKLLLLIPEFYPLHDISQIVLLPQVIISGTNEVDKWSLDVGKTIGQSYLEVWSWFSKLNLYAHKRGG